jgi:hypothetical protein
MDFFDERYVVCGQSDLAYHRRVAAGEAAVAPWVLGGARQVRLSTVVSKGSDDLKIVNVKER